MGNLKDLTGKKFDRLTVLKYDGNDGKNSYWIVQCECGSRPFKTQRSALITGATTSCGCKMLEINRERATRDGLNQKGLQKLKEESFVDGTSLKALKRKNASNNTSGVKGVSFKKGAYEANIRFKGKLIYLGRFKTLEDAKEARIEAEKKYYEPIIAKYDNRLNIK